jgi:hypothetical protein
MKKSEIQSWGDLFALELMWVIELGVKIVNWIKWEIKGTGPRRDPRQWKYHVIPKSRKKKLASECFLDSI